MTAPAEATSPATAATAGTVVELGEQSFGETIGGHTLALVDFWAPWCAPCRAFAPTFAAAAARHPDLLFAKVNTEDEQRIAAHFNIRSIPTLMIFRDDIIVYSEAGALPAAGLEQVIAAARALDMDDVRKQVAAQQAAEASGTAS
jgi:thioredoxin 1